MIDRESIISQIRALQRMWGDAPACPEGRGLAAMIDQIWSIEKPDDQLLLTTLSELREGFDRADAQCHEDVFHGWSQWRHRPGGRDVRAARRLHELRRVLAVTAGDRSIAAEQQVIYSDGDPLVRIEIREGATLAQVVKAIARAVGLMLVSWPRLIDHKTADQVKGFEPPASPGNARKEAASKGV